MSATVVHLPTSGTSQPAMARFEFYRQQLLSSLVTLAKSDTPRDEILDEVDGTLNAIRDIVEVMGVKNRLPSHESRDWLPLTPMPQPCQETHGAIWLDWTMRQLRHMFRHQVSEHTDA